MLHSHPSLTGADGAVSADIYLMYIVLNYFIALFHDILFYQEISEL